MRAALRRLPLEAATSVAVAATILALALGSNWSPGVRHVAGPLRWVGLFAICALALARVYAAGRAARPAWPALAAAAAFTLVALVSTVWSVDPRLTFARAVSFAVLLAAAAALSVAVAGDGPALRRALYSVLAGAVLVALAGIAVYLVRHASAIQQPTVQNGVRYRGVGQNPNTVSMLLAVATPIAALLAVEARTWLLRATGIAAFLLLAGSIVASGSRGALVASFGALAVLGLVWPHTWRMRAAAVLAAAACLAIGAGITKLPDPLSPNDPRAQTSASANPHAFSPRDADFSLRLEDEIGRPAGGAYRPPEHRGLLGGSGRTQAWQGGIDQGKKRPLAGYGFGTEPKVFVDRYYSFEGGVPENSFVGLFLQLGVVGPLLFLLLVATLAVAGARALRTLADRGAVAVCASVLLVGLALAVVQSYVYSAGNTATLGVWICSFLPAAASARGQ